MRNAVTCTNPSKATPGVLFRPSPLCTVLEPRTSVQTGEFDRIVMSLVHWVLNPVVNTFYKYLFYFCKLSNIALVEIRFHGGEVVWIFHSDVLLQKALLHRMLSQLGFHKGQSRHSVLILSMLSTEKNAGLVYLRIVRR
jgi:hypothetical protein